MSISNAELLQRVETIALEAGRLVMEVYATEFAVDSKEDASPVTLADQRAEALIVDALQALAPDIPIVAEEFVAAGCVPDIGDRFWLVDPLDGTREFIKRNGEFTVNVALIEDARPVLGVVCAPALGTLYAGAAAGPAYVRSSAGTQALRCRSVPAEGLTVVASASHGDVAALEAFLAGRRVAARRAIGSSLKLCLVAAGAADVYPRFGRTMEWDIAAGHAVLTAAGGRLTTLEGEPFAYGKAADGFKNGWFVARGA